MNPAVIVLRVAARKMGREVFEQTVKKAATKAAKLPSKRVLEREAKKVASLEHKYAQMAKNATNESTRKYYTKLKNRAAYKRRSLSSSATLEKRAKSIADSAAKMYKDAQKYRPDRLPSTLKSNVKRELYNHLFTDFMESAQQAAKVAYLANPNNLMNYVGKNIGDYIYSSLVSIFDYMPESTLTKEEKDRFFVANLPHSKTGRNALYAGLSDIWDRPDVDYKDRDKIIMEYFGVESMYDVVEIMNAETGKNFWDQDAVDGFSEEKYRTLQLLAMRYVRRWGVR